MTAWFGSAPSPDNLRQARDFLEWLRPGGPWYLWGLAGARAGCCAESPEQAVEWLASRGDGLVHINELSPGPGFSGRARKDDVPAVQFLVADIDPEPVPDGQDPALWDSLEQERLLRLLEDFSPAPSAVLRSGYGLHVLWRLERPAACRDGERACMALAQRLGGDSAARTPTFTVRIPGTRNIPTSASKADREVRMVRLLSANDNVTDVWQIIDEAAGPTKDPLANVTPVPVAGLDQLPEGIPEEVLEALRTGRWEDKGRSESGQAAAYYLARQSVDADLIAGILLNPELRISDHYLGQPNPQRAAQRSVLRAHERVNHPKLEEFNSRYVWVSDMERVAELREDGELVLHKKAGWLTTVAPEIAFQDEQGKTRAGPWWLAHPRRRTVRTVKFYPGHDEEHNECLNLWRGWPVPPEKGDSHQPFLDFVREVICSGDQEHYDYLLRWMARGVQQPDRPGEVAFVMYSRGLGTGKTFFADTYGSLFGRHYGSANGPNDVVGRFNTVLSDCKVFFADEAFFAKDPRTRGILNGLLTSKTLRIERKGVDPVWQENYLQVIMASNEEVIIPARGDERRYFVLEVSAKHKQDRVYFGPLFDLMDTRRARANLLHYLMHEVSLEGWDVRDVPQTQALQDQKILSAQFSDPATAWWYDCMQEADLCNMGQWGKWVHRDVVRASLREACGDDYLSPTLLNRTLSRISCGAIEQRVRRHDGRITREFYCVQPLDRCRAMWDADRGRPTDWKPLPEEEDEEETEE